MANPLRGEVDFVVGDKTYTLRLSINQLIEAEDLLDLSALQIAVEFQKGVKAKSRVVRAVLWAGLQPNHPDVDLEQAGEIMSEAGIAPTIRATSKAIEKAFPKPEAGKGPPAVATKEAGTGNGSSSPSEQSTQQTQTVSGD